RGHLKALEYAMAHTGCEAVNLGTGKGYSVLEIVHTFEKVNGVAVPYAIGPRRAGDVAAVYADPKKAEALLGWKAELGLEEMCRDAWKWQKDNPEGFPKAGAP
ncbi:MAG: UDP-glucose 4-epimerase, partial [Clostridiales bacterium]|nr:UDP-glucose 4-epimerase [Clostridiales bacterium]